jgi:aminopeptidase C
MENQKINQEFLARADDATRREILESIARHYGISQKEAFNEIVGENAEHLLDYLVEPIRSAVSVLMQRAQVREEYQIQDMKRIQALRLSNSTATRLGNLPAKIK